MKRFYESSSIAHKYLQFRPTYTTPVAEAVMKYYRSQQQNTNAISNKLELMIDVGCGSGQSTNIFHPFFETIIGIDVSSEQLKHARQQNKYNNIHYMDGAAENLPADNHSVDVVVTATALHWFNIPKFYEEARRVLKPNGVLAILGYTCPTISFSLDENEMITQEASSYFYDLVIGCANKFPIRKAAYGHSVDRYRKIFEKLPFLNKQRNDSLHYVANTSVNGLCGMIRSTDAYQAFVQKYCGTMEYKKIGDSLNSISDPIINYKSSLCSLCGISDKEHDKNLFTVDYNFFLLLSTPMPPLS